MSTGENRYERERERGRGERERERERERESEKGREVRKRVEEFVCLFVCLVG